LAVWNKSAIFADKIGDGKLHLNNKDKKNAFLK